MEEKTSKRKERNRKIFLSHSNGKEFHCNEKEKSTNGKEKSLSGKVSH